MRDCQRRTAITSFQTSTGEADNPPAPLSFAIQNCNSLGLSVSTANFDMKLAAIVLSKADVILLSDTRVISLKGVSSTQRIRNSLRDCKLCSYSVRFNSNSNSRGVAILIKNALQYSIIKEYRDDSENVYIIDTEINGIRYGIGAIYGPNNTSREFYRFIKNTLQDLSSNGVHNIVLGGDWNTTFDRRPIVDNIDTFHMAGLPNPKNSELLEQLCRSFSLYDPYRVLFPTRKDYTYSPFGTVRLNRSRLDFFYHFRKSY
jgi:exonuclease III